MSQDTNANLPKPTAIFADAAAASLLEDHIERLCDPRDARWQCVKSNASRTVYRGSIGGRRLYIKQFHSRDSGHRLAHALGFSGAKREMRLSSHLAAHGVPAAPVLAVLRTGGHDFLTMEEIAPATPADQWHEQQLAAGPAGRSAIRRQTLAVADLIAAMHESGVVHGDLHCGNILVRTDGPSPKLMLMDLHRASRHRRVSRRRRAANLAQLLHDRYELTTRCDRLRFLKRYLRASSAGGSLGGWQRMIEDFARRHRQGQYARRDARILSRNRYFSPIKLEGGWSGHVALAAKRPIPYSPASRQTFSVDDWREALRDVPALLASPAAQVVKETEVNTTWRATLDVAGRRLDVFIKRTKHRNTLKTLINCFRHSRDTRAFRMGHAMLIRRVATAFPLACLSRRVGPLLADSILITEAVPGQELHDFLETALCPAPRGDVRLTPPQRRQLAQDVLWQLGRMLQGMHDDHFAHRDLQEDNMVVHWSPGQSPRVVLLDMEAVRKYRRLTARRQFQGLMRLNVSLLRCAAVNHAGRLRMLLGYLRRPGSGHINFKPYWRTLDEWSQKKLYRKILSEQRRQKAIRRPSL